MLVTLALLVYQQIVEVEHWRVRWIAVDGSLFKKLVRAADMPRALIMDCWSPLPGTIKEAGRASHAPVTVATPVHVSTQTAGLVQFVAATAMSHVSTQTAGLVQFVAATARPAVSAPGRASPDLFLASVGRG